MKNRRAFLIVALAALALGSRALAAQEASPDHNWMVGVAGDFFYGRAADLPSIPAMDVTSWGFGLSILDIVGARSGFLSLLDIAWAFGGSCGGAGYATQGLSFDGLLVLGYGAIVQIGEGELILGGGIAGVLDMASTDEYSRAGFTSHSQLGLAIGVGLTLGTRIVAGPILLAVGLDAAFGFVPAMPDHENLDDSSLLGQKLYESSGLIVMPYIRVML